MKEFKFLLEKKQPPPEVMILTNIEERKANIIHAMQDRERVELTIRSKGLVSATSLLLKIVKKEDQYYLMMDSLVPAQAEAALIDVKAAMISYKLDNVSCAFLSKLMHYQRSNRTFIMSFPSKIFRLQRRMFFRVDISMKAMIHVVPEHLIDSVKLPAFDISEGGISFFAKEEHDFETGAFCPLAILMPNGVLIHTRAEVRNVLKHTGNRRYPLRICCEYTDIEKQNRELIAKYVFTRQMEEIQKRRGD